MGVRCQAAPASPEVVTVRHAISRDLRSRLLANVRRARAPVRRMPDVERRRAERGTGSQQFHGRVAHAWPALPAARALTSDVEPNLRPSGSLAARHDVAAPRPSGVPTEFDARSRGIIAKRTGNLGMMNVWASGRRATRMFLQQATGGRQEPLARLKRNSARGLL